MKALILMRSSSPLPHPPTYPLTVLAAENGKHVFLEKPMALNLEECDGIHLRNREAQGDPQVGFMRRFDPEFVAAAERIEAGEIGTPMMVKSNTHGPGLAPRLGARPAYLQWHAGGSQQP